jgi:hypothetical protein
MKEWQHQEKPPHWQVIWHNLTKDNSNEKPDFSEKPCPSEKSSKILMGNPVVFSAILRPSLLAITAVGSKPKICTVEVSSATLWWYYIHIRM